MFTASRSPVVTLEVSSHTDHVSIRVGYPSCCSYTVASEQYFRCRSKVSCSSSSSNSDCNSSNNSNVITVWYPRCHLSCLYCLYTMKRVWVFISLVTSYQYLSANSHTYYYLVFHHPLTFIPGLKPSFSVYPISGVVTLLTY